MRTIFHMTATSLIGLVVLCLLLFLPAGTFNYWQAWAFIVVFSLCTLLPSIYLLVNDPAALERRMRAGPGAETRPVQKIIIGGAFLLAPAALVLSVLDHRFGWSNVPTAVSVIGLVLVGVGLTLSQLVVIQNSYAAATITVEESQQVVSTGLYGFVRHPLYVGVIVMMTGIPIALGSWWCLLFLIPCLAALAVRITDEEKMLESELAGYREYEQKVRYRLVPLVW